MKEESNGYTVTLRKLSQNEDILQMKVVTMIQRGQKAESIFFLVQIQ